MLLAFKHRIQNKPFPDVLINLWTRSPWVHVEILLEDAPRRGWAIGARTAGNGVQLSSQWTDALTTVPQAMWEFYRVPVRSEKEVWEFLGPQLGKHFNYSSVIGAQGLGLPVQNQKTWFCSELAYALVQQCSTLAFAQVEPISVHPGKLREYCIRAGCELVKI
jgi:hypothetical protein